VSDPTRIDIAFDPTVQRMSGRAVHGNTPFDTAYASEITSNLWTGGCRNGLELPSVITDVVSLYPWERYVVRHKLRSFLEVRMYDSAAQPDRAEVDSIADWINERRRDGVVLVHCQAGLNRSGLVAATALVRDGMTPDVAIELLRSKRCGAVLCNPTFHEFVWRYNAKGVES
jgi:protein-tyrosine phosphatase